MPQQRRHGQRFAGLAEHPPPSVPTIGVRILAVLLTVLAGMAALSRLVTVPTTEVTYRAVVDAVQDSPAWLHVEAIGELGLIALAGALLVTAWRARGHEDDALARVLLGGVGAAVAYLVSETLKVLLAQNRPCQVLPDVEVLATCPGLGDWSLPSNHATIAGALATALVFSAARAWLAFTVAALVAASRVVLGVHYPHDVVTGLLLGAVVVTLTAVVLHTPARRAVRVGTAVPWIATLLGRRVQGTRHGDHS